MSVDPAYNDSSAMQEPLIGVKSSRDRSHRICKALQWTALAVTFGVAAAALGLVIVEIEYFSYWVTEVYLRRAELVDPTIHVSGFDTYLSFSTYDDVFTMHTEGKGSIGNYWNPWTHAFFDKVTAETIFTTDTISTYIARADYVYADYVYAHNILEYRAKSVNESATTSRTLSTITEDDVERIMDLEFTLDKDGSLEASLESLERTFPHIVHTENGKSYVDRRGLNELSLAALSHIMRKLRALEDALPV